MLIILFYDMQSLPNRSVVIFKYLENNDPQISGSFLYRERPTKTKCSLLELYLGMWFQTTDCKGQ